MKENILRYSGRQRSSKVKESKEVDKSVLWRTERLWGLRILKGEMNRQGNRRGLNELDQVVHRKREGEAESERKSKPKKVLGAFI
jgi:hypothetical protein